ncbi:hypothetical protein ACEPAI_9244 [Sanghuangporus weigelae]
MENQGDLETNGSGLCKMYTTNQQSIAILRGLQIATSEPKGPVYLWARREMMEEVVDEGFAKTPVDVRTWMPMESPGLNQSVPRTIADSLINAKNPLVITSYLGRNPKAVGKLVELSERLSIPILVACPTTVNFPYGHPNFVGLTFGVEPNRWLRGADTLLIIDSDNPYIPMHNKPRATLEFSILMWT